MAREDTSFAFAMPEEMLYPYQKQKPRYGSPRRVFAYLLIVSRESLALGFEPLQQRVHHAVHLVVRNRGAVRRLHSDGSVS